MTNKKMNFEKAMQQLERIVQELEQGDLSLEKALKKFEEGVKLSRYCSEQLEQTEKKISLLLEDAQGKIVAKEFDAQKDPGAE